MAGFLAVVMGAFSSPPCFPSGRDAAASLPSVGSRRKRDRAERRDGVEFAAVDALDESVVPLE
jgi:hypothetical protein